MKNLKTNNNASLTYKTGYNETETLDINKVKDAVIDCHGIIDLILKDIPVDIFSVLGMRNLSAFIGELFAKNLERVCDGLYKSNPHQDGYPDLLLMNAQGLKPIFCGLDPLPNNYHEASRIVETLPQQHSQ